MAGLRCELQVIPSVVTPCIPPVQLPKACGAGCLQQFDYSAAAPLHSCSGAMLRLAQRQA